MAAGQIEKAIKGHGTSGNLDRANNVDRSITRRGTVQGRNERSLVRMQKISRGCEVLHGQRHVHYNPCTTGAAHLLGALSTQQIDPRCTVKSPSLPALYNCSSSRSLKKGAGQLVQIKMNLSGGQTLEVWTAGALRVEWTFCQSTSCNSYVSML